METIKEKSIKVNEKLRDMQKKVFYMLIKIHKVKFDQIKLGMHVKEMKEKYHKA
jgi:hypothetical protein